MPSNEIAGSYGSSIVSFLNKLHILIYSVCINLHSHQHCKRISISPQLLSHLLFVDCFMMMVILSSVIWYLILIFIYLLISDAEHLFMCLPYICMSYLGKCLFRSSAHSLLLLFFFSFWYWAAWAIILEVAWRLILTSCFICKYFPPYVGCLYILFIVFFAYTLRNLNSKWHMHPNVHWSTAYNSQDMEATLMPSRQMDKKAVVHIHNGILLSH